MSTTILSFLIAILIVGIQFLAGYLKNRIMGLVLPVLFVLVVLSQALMSGGKWTPSNVFSIILIILVGIGLLVYEYYTGLQFRKKRDQLKK